MTTDPAIASAEHWFRQIYLLGIPLLVERQETAFLSLLCMLAGVDALSGYRYQDLQPDERYAGFIRGYFPPSYFEHADKLYLLRCRMLHNASPAHFTLVHGQPQAHLQRSAIEDTILNAGSFFRDFQDAANRFFAELQVNPELQAAMLARISNLNRGGGLWVVAGS